MTKIKDPISALTHLLWAVLAIPGLVFLIVRASLFGTAWDVVSCSIFGTSLILLYSASGIYHMLKVSEKASLILRKLDHIMIFVLIAGTYTPLALGPLRGPWGWSIFGVSWGLAVAGILLTALTTHTPRWIRTGIYLGMGWIVIIAIYPMITMFKQMGIYSELLWLMAGGLFYTVGGIMYGLKKPNFNNKYFGFHELFHIFVMAGSLCHYILIYRVL
jgi:hemolysin III